MIFDAKHEMIRKLVRQFAETELTTEVLDKVEETGEFPEEIVDKMAKCGFLGLKIPREYGGAGADTLAYIIMIEEIARVSAVASLYANTPNSLGGGPLMIRCKYGNILKNPSNAIYYKCNMESSGVELRINGRAIEHGMFDRVWGEAIHPSQNRFLVQVDLITDNPAALPATKNTKTSFCEADPRLKNLLSWIASYVPAPAKDVDSVELRYVKELTAKREKDPTALRVSREEPVFQKIGLKAKVDLFVGCVNGVTIYEAKAGKTKALDLYQLRMYVDGCALDNKPVDEAILIARYHPPEVRELLDILNGLSAPDGRPYNFRLVTWDEEGIFVQQSA